MSKIQLSKNFIRNTCRLALAEDLYPSGDITSSLINKDNIVKTAKILTNGKNSTLVLGGKALNEKCTELAGKIAAKTGCGIITEAANSRLSRGEGRVQMLRIHDVNEILQGIKVFREINIYPTSKTN